MRSRGALGALGARFAIALVTCAWLVAGGVGYALWFANDVYGDRQVIDLDLEPAAATDPVNFLIIGSDTRDFVDTDAETDAFGDPAEQSGQRSDTMMVVHLDPKSGATLLVSFPRDLWVDVPGEGMAKLNAAYSRGGARLAVDTIQSNFGFTINHYLEVNFATFREIVDGIGAVHLFFPTPARDTVTGLNVLLPGCVPLNSDQALAYVRSREYEYYDASGDWRKDPTADIGRIRRQQYFIRSLMNEAVNRGARDFGTAKKLLRRTVQKLRMDEQLALTDLYALFQAFRSADASGVEMVTIPADLDRSPDGQSILVVRDDEARPFLRRLRNLDRPSAKPAEPNVAVKPATVSVGVLNGSGLQGAASSALDALVDLGYQRGTAGNADRDDYDTTEVRYRRGQRDGARLVASDLVADAQLIEDDDIEFDVVVVLGRDFAGVIEPEGPITTPASVDTTTTIAANPGTTPGVIVPPSEAGRPLVGCG